MNSIEDVESCKRFDPVLLAALDATLRLPNWAGLGGLDEYTMYGELAMDVAKIAVAAEREACAKIADDHEKAAIDQCWLTAKSIASVIRARGDQP